MLPIGAIAPNITAETTEGRIRFQDWIGDGWAILFSHPKTFTPVCTTELGAVARLLPKFTKRHPKVIGLRSTRWRRTGVGPGTSRRGRGMP